MKTSVRLLILGTLVALLASCPMPFTGGVRGGDAPAATFSLPGDQSTDVRRVAEGEFTFETLLPVQLSLAVDLYAIDEDGALLPDPLPTGDTNVIVRLESRSGSAHYTGRLRDDGTLDATVYLPSAASDVVMTLSAPGFDSRTVTIPQMVRYSRIERRMAMRQSSWATGVARSISGLIDSDGDGVPDVYDAFPNDPNAAFVQNVPADGNLTIAFEDLFGRANAGDADYNDFIASYRIQEISNADGYITSIRVDATAVVKLAGYNHRFGIRIDRFDGVATLEREYIDFDGATRTQTVASASGPVEVELFENSATAVGKSAWFTLSFDTPQRQPDSPVVLSEPPYNPWVIVRNTGHDIHLIDREPLTELITSKNPNDRFVDSDGFPWALLVPEEWIHPAEAKRIDSDEWYPRFTNWRLSGGEEFTDWYHYLGEPWVEPETPPTVYVAGYRNDGTRDVAAYWVITSDETSPTRIDLPVPANSGGARANDIFVDEDGVFVAGWYRDGTTRNTVAALWANGELSSLTDPVDVGRAGAVTRISGTTVVAASSTRVDGTADTAFVWTDGSIA
ncbi:MAG: LruC domain-containing protein, partial [Spirochaetaceae bacterium]